MLHVLVTCVLVTCLRAVTRGDGYCVTYGDCGGLPCVNNTPAQPMWGQGLDIVGELCPHLKVEGGYCCDDTQVGIMKSAISKADSLLKRCRTGQINFRSLVCDMVCGPDQANYIQITQAEQYGLKTRATHLKYFISTTYSDKVWRSTRGESKLLCGNLFSECSKHDLYNFIGNNRWTKLKTDYVIENSPSRQGIKHASHYHMSCDEDSCLC